MPKRPVGLGSKYHLLTVGPFAPPGVRFATMCCQLVVSTVHEGHQWVQTRRHTIKEQVHVWQKYFFSICKATHQFEPMPFPEYLAHISALIGCLDARPRAISRSIEDKSAHAPHLQRRHGCHDKPPEGPAPSCVLRACPRLEAYRTASKPAHACTLAAPCVRVSPEGPQRPQPRSQRRKAHAVPLGKHPVAGSSLKWL